MLQNASIGNEQLEMMLNSSTLAVFLRMMSALFGKVAFASHVCANLAFRWLHLRPPQLQVAFAANCVCGSRVRKYNYKPPMFFLYLNCN